MSILDRAKKHFKDQPIIEIKVPEWADENGDATVLYSKPFTMKERQTLYKFADGDDLEFMIRLVIMKALDSDGNKLFDLTNKKDFENTVDPNVIMRIAGQMTVTPSIEEIEGN